MNKKQFKQEIFNFLNEIDTRSYEIIANCFNPTFIVGKKLNDFVRTNFKDEYKLVYSVSSVRLDIIFHMNNKKNLLNGSNNETMFHLYNALKYQIIANKYLYKDISLEDFYYVYWGYMSRLIKNVNFTETYNANNKICYIKDQCTYIYFTDEAIKRTYEEIFIKNIHIVLDLNKNKKTINIKNKDYKVMKRLTKKELINIIEDYTNEFDCKPTIKQITEKYMSSINLIDTDNIEDKDEYEEAIEYNNSKIISKELMLSYVKQFELTDMIKFCNHTEKFKNKHK